jgi:hypothetical protein
MVARLYLAVKLLIEKNDERTLEELHEADRLLYNKATI